MAKLSIDTSHVFTSGRGEKETVAQALAWASKHAPELEPADLIVYAVRRLRALHKDVARVEKGVLASRLYSPRIDMLDKAPKGLVAAVESIGAVAERLHPEPAPAAKPKPRPMARSGKDETGKLAPAGSIAAKRGAAARRAARKA
jgi:Na+-transporting methylmalonyl-CoA/oxaloacetate decarboxylase gamma subunit